jgi:hypothetical protein
MTFEECLCFNDGPLAMAEKGKYLERAGCEWAPATQNQSINQNKWQMF